jgi:hypothetical protein
MGVEAGVGELNPTQELKMRRRREDDDEVQEQKWTEKVSTQWRKKRAASKAKTTKARRRRNKRKHAQTSGSDAGSQGENGEASGSGQPAKKPLNNDLRRDEFKPGGGGVPSAKKVESKKEKDLLPPLVWERILKQKESQKQRSLVPAFVAKPLLPSKSVDTDPANKPTGPVDTAVNFLNSEEEEEDWLEVCCNDESSGEEAAGEDVMKTGMEDETGMEWGQEEVEEEAEEWTRHTEGSNLGQTWAGRTIRLPASLPARSSKPVSEARPGQKEAGQKAVNNVSEVLVRWPWKVN